jgi:hypothetical protein
VSNQSPNVPRRTHTELIENAAAIVSRARVLVELFRRPASNLHVEPASTLSAARKQVLAAHQALADARTEVTPLEWERTDGEYLLDELTKLNDEMRLLL